MKLKVNPFLVFIFLFSFLMACKKEEKKKVTNFATVGEAELWCDESLKNIIGQQEEVFENNYKYAKLTINYKGEQEIIKAFYQDSIDVMIVSSMIDSNDLKKFKAKNVIPRQYLLATSAIAFITGLNGNIDSLSGTKLRSMLQDKNSKQRFVIENKNSGIAKVLLQASGLEAFGQNVFAKGTKKEIIDWVKNNPNDIGVVDWSDISDSDDPEAKKILSEIKLLSVSNDKGNYFKPYQYNLNGDYPFTRDIYLIRKFGITDITLGFASFICAEIGQKIFLKGGLLPSIQTERIVEFKGLIDIEVVK
jgi:phosphate transport system substrate-binding protein